MKRFFLFLSLLFLMGKLFPLYAQSPTAIPSGGVEQLTGGVVIPGITCGIAEDPDFEKTKCCVSNKQDTSTINTISDFASDFPVVGGYIGGLSDKYNSVNSIQDAMDPCTYGVPSTPNNIKSPNCVCFKSASDSAIPAFNTFCTKYFAHNGSSIEKLKCLQCMETSGGFYTAIGCIPLNLSTFVTNYILSIGIGIAGGVALLCIFYSAFRMQTSMGNAEAIKKAQENLTACITGLIIIIFSVLILKIVGVSILKIPL